MPPRNVQRTKQILRRRCMNKAHAAAQWILKEEDGAKTTNDSRPVIMWSKQRQRQRQSKIYTGSTMCVCGFTQKMLYLLVDQKAIKRAEQSLKAWSYFSLSLQSVSLVDIQHKHRKINASTQLLVVTEQTEQSQQAAVNIYVNKWGTIVAEALQSCCVYLAQVQQHCWQWI